MRMIFYFLTQKSAHYSQLRLHDYEYYSSSEPISFDRLLLVVRRHLLFQRIVLPADKKVSVPDLRCLQGGNGVCRKEQVII